MDGLWSERTNSPSDDLAIWADDRLPSIPAVVVVDEVVEEFIAVRQRSTVQQQLLFHHSNLCRN